MARTERIATCPSDELLLAYLLQGSGGTEPAEVGTHLQSCDRCIEELSRAHRRLSLAQEIATPVPAALAAQVAESFGRPLAVVATPNASRKPLLNRMRRQLGNLRPAVWAPVALAAAVLLALALRLPQPGSAPLTELTRDVQLRQDARITSANAGLRQQPNDRAPILRTLNRGDAVVLFDRSEDWYQVALPDGTQGWIEIGAFE